MKRTLIAIALFALAAMPASAQRINLDFPGLEAKASEVVDVTLDASMLRLASKFLSEHKQDERAAREVINGLEGIYVRSYEFEKEGEYDRSIVDRVRGQLGANWNRIVTVRSKTKENVEIYTLGKNTINGLVIISAEPKELTIVNIVGPIDLERLGDLEGQFGIPKMTKEPTNAKEGRP